MAGVVFLLVALGINGAPGAAHVDGPSSSDEVAAQKDGGTVPSAPLQVAERRPRLGPTPARTQFAPPPALIAKPAESDVEDDSSAVALGIPIGTKILAAILTQLRTDRSVAGQDFVARVADPVVWNGREVIPVDAQLRGIVDAVVPGRQGQAPSLQLSLTEIRLNGRATRIRTARYTVVAPESGDRDGRALTIVIGAAVGTAIGGAVGGESGAVIGAAAGVAAGAAVPARSTVGGEYVLGNHLTFKLLEALRLPPGAG